MSTAVGETRTVGGYLALPLIWLVRAYQVLVSPLLGPSCKFYPSCSAYALTALRRYGPVKGTWLAARRLGRCHPWSHGGVDHVPARESGRDPGHHDTDL
ncbi:membrane protein insertion efficiency factor YidD [Ornithinimicrobium sp. F0845]|uniref:membrane protein insertion efficiency factor YidD n=1 Tax=Ornithinimicrobium sp. F0845 TaxID=2926412 RepID=UPI001FF417FC|nr:membrane protein insertion efficiency factor YidD [Ornithinimicrobium sp. F0845]MCK0113479.1 membrane protein insertion efficiency factor YidD [Ornithinimicrobium sp. F0845]